MRCLRFLACLPVLTGAVNIVISNDDGWAEVNIRQFYYALVNAGHNVVLSAPADNESGTGSSDATPKPLTDAGEFDSIPAGSPATGYNASMPRFNYVNSYPVTSMRYGIQSVSNKFFGRAPDLAVAGFNVGSNLGSTTQRSGTVGAATEAVKEGIPAIAFSGRTGSQTAWNIFPIPRYVTTYATLSAMVTKTLISSGTPYLPSDIWLNVNFPSSSSSHCSTPSTFKFVLSRINKASPSTPADVNTCGSIRLPIERDVVTASGCYASVSVGLADTKGDADAKAQAIVLGKLKSILTCLPS